MPALGSVLSSDSSDADDENIDSGSSSGGDSSSNSSNSDSDSEESEDEAGIARLKAKNEARKRAMADAQEAIDAWMNNADKTPSPQKVKKETSKNTSGSKAFKRVDTEVWSKEIISGLEDNTYEKTFGDGGYGARASAKLLKSKERSFSTRRQRQDRAAATRGAIDASAASKSFKYADSD